VSQAFGRLTGALSESGECESNGDLSQDLLTALLSLPIHQQVPLQRHNLENHLQGKHGLPVAVITMIPTTTAQHGLHVSKFLDSL